MTSAEEKTNAFKWQYRLAENTRERIKFVLPRTSLFLIALLGASLGLILLLSPGWFEKQPQAMISIAGWGGVFLGLSLFYFVLTRSGEVNVEGARQIVIVVFKSPKQHTVLHLPFSDFRAIETRQVKDMHGLHNHWSIELVGLNDVRIKVGSSFNGTFRVKVRDSLVNKISEMIGIPVNYLGDK